MVAMAAVQLEKVNTHSTPETEPAEALQQLEAAAAFQGPWREAYLLMMPQDYQDLAQLTAATQRAIAEGKNEHARFFIEQTVSCADKMQEELEKIKAFSQATIDCRSIGNKKRAEDMQTLSENCFYTLLRDLRADSPGLTDAELIEEKQEIRDAIDLVLIAQTVNQDFASTEELLELIDQNKHAADNLFRIFVKLLPHSPEFAQSILKKLRAHCQKKTIPSFVNNVFGTDGELQSELGHNLIQAADKIEKDELVFIITALVRSGYHIDQLEMLVPHLETLGANTDQLMQDLINAFWTDSGATSIEFFTYLAQKKDISLMMKFFPKYFPTQDYVTLAARAFIDKYKTAEAAIRAGKGYTTAQLRGQLQEWKQK